MGQPQPFCQGLGEKCRLVVSSLSFSLALEWYWNHHVRCQPIRFAVHHFSQPLGKPRSQRLHLLKLQQQNGSHHGA